MSGASAEGSESRWYALWTRSRHERVVTNELHRKGIEAFLPTVARVSRWKDRQKRMDWPLFPSYCFAQFPLVRRTTVLTCQGVLSIVSVAGQPAPVSDDEVNSIRLFVANAVPYDPCPLLSEGDLVRVTSGPLRGVVGRLLRKHGSHAAVVLSVELLGQGIRVELDASHIALHS